MEGFTLSTVYAFFAPGPTEIILIIAGVLLLFGGKKIPELMRGLGSGLKEFKQASAFDEPNEKPAERIEGQSNTQAPQNTQATQSTQTTTSS